jgi:hypothetical protein
MSVHRHSYVGFYPSDWIAGTARMSRMHKSVYFDVCCYTWDQNRPCPAAELPLMLGDIPNWRELINDLVDAGKLHRAEDGSVCNERAASEAQKAFDLWDKKSRGGRTGAAKTNAAKSGSPDATPDGTPASTPDGSNPKTAGSPDAEPEPEPDTKPDGLAAAAADPKKMAFDLGLQLLKDAGHPDRHARSLMGKWHRDFGAPRLMEALLDCQAQRIINPVEWMPKRMGKPSPRTRSEELIGQREGFF